MRITANIGHRWLTPEFLKGTFLIFEKRSVRTKIAARDFSDTIAPSGIVIQLLQFRGDLSEGSVLLNFIIPFGLPFAHCIILRLRDGVLCGILCDAMETAGDHLQVRGLKHFKRLAPLLQRLDKVGCQRDKAGNRLLKMSDYCLAVLLYLWNPSITSIRMLQETMGLNQVARALKVRRFSLGSFSESSAVFDPAHLKRIVDELAGELIPLGKEPRL